MRLIMVRSGKDETMKEEDRKEIAWRNRLVCDKCGLILVSDETFSDEPNNQVICCDKKMRIC